MSFFGRLFGKDAPAPFSVRADAAVRNHVKLAYSAPLANVDATLVDALREQGAAYLKQWRSSHLQVFRGQVAKPLPQLPPTLLLRTELESLARSIVSWDARLIPELHDLVTKGRQDWEGDVLAVFFHTSVNASHYDALIVEESIRAATATFDDAVAIAATLYPSVTAEELSQLRLIWTVPLFGLSVRWKEMHRARFDEIYRSWPSHQHAESLANAFAAMCRAHFQVEAQAAVRLYRQTLFPVVTSVFAQTLPPDALKAIDPATLESLRTMAFDGFPIDDVWKREPQLASAYLIGWTDLSQIAAQTLQAALEKGREQYASEIQSMDCEEQFANLGEAALNAEFRPLFDDVRTFYVRRITG